MKPVTNNDIMTMMREFMSPINAEKQASEEISQIKATSGKDQTEEEKKGDGTPQGAAGSEKRNDIEKGMEGNSVSAQSGAADVKNGDGETYADNAGTKSLDADEKVNQETVNVKRTEDPAEDNKVNNKGETGGHGASQKQAFVRNLNLANRIYEELDALARNFGGHQKIAAEQEMFEKQAAAAYEMGVRQRAQDFQELMSTGAFSPEQANALLDKIAMETPEDVLPPEAVPPEVADEIAGGDVDEGVATDDDAVLDDLSAALEAEGVTPEDLQQAAETVDALQQQGVSPDEIVQAVSELAEEAQPGEEAAEKAAHQINRNNVEMLKDVFRQSF